MDDEARAAATASAFGEELEDPRQPFTLIARLVARRGMEAKLEAAFARASGQTLREEGLLTYDLNRDARDPARFVVYERWRSLADFEAHLRNPWVSVLRCELEEMLAVEPEFDVLTPRNFLSSL